VGANLPPLIVAAVGVALWWWHTPPVGDLAAQQAWAELVRRAGDVPWFARWYGGVPVGGYSLVTPPLMAALGVRAVGALATLATAALARPLLAGARRPTAGASALALAAVADLYSGRVTFAAGAAVALGAVLAAERRRSVVAAELAVLAGLTSPVAGLFLLLPAAVYVLSGGPRRRSGFALGVAAGSTIAVVAAVFPVAGREPFADFVFRPAVEIPLLAALLPVSRRVRLGLLLGALAVTLAYLVPGPVGSNVTRLSILVAVPAVIAAARLPLVLLAPVAFALALWPWHQLHDDLLAARDASAQPGFSTALGERLRADPLAVTHRIEVVQPRTHWAETRLANQGLSLARGWIRQVDEGRNPQFYGRAPLTADTYRSFLDSYAVAYVAAPRGVPVDFGSSAEAALVQAGLPYLTLVWSDPHWELFAVTAPAPVAAGVARVTRLTDTGADLTATGRGTVRLAVRWSPWLVLDGGSVQRDGAWARLTVNGPGPRRLHAVWRWP
jgi:hypothetical protein